MAARLAVPRALLTTSIMPSRTTFRWAGLRPRLAGSGAAAGGSRRLASRARRGTTAQPAVGDARRHHRQLQRRRQHVALADAGDHRLARRPGRAEPLLLPFRGRQQAAAFVRQIDAERHPQAEPPAHGGDPVDADAPRHLVEVAVAGLRDGVAQVASEPWPPRFQQWKLGVAEAQMRPGRRRVDPGSIAPRSSAASATTGLKVEPGAYWPAIALLISGALRVGGQRLPLRRASARG